MNFLVAAIAIFSLLPREAHADRPCPTQRNETQFVLAPIRRVTEVQSLPTMVAPGAILATEAIELELSLKRTSDRIDLVSPLAVHFEKGTLVGTRLVDGQMQYCVFWGYLPFQPPRDDEGRLFPTICLGDAAGDGKFEMLQFFSYGGALGKGIVLGRIEPVGLENLSSPPGEYAHSRIFRRLRVETVESDRASVVVEHAVVPFTRFEADPEYQSASSSEAVALRAGDTEVAGLKLALTHVNHAWTAVPSGPFEAWFEPYCEGSLVRIKDPETVARDEGE